MHSNAASALMILIPTITLCCAVAMAQQTNHESSKKHGLVGLRPLPRDEGDWLETYWKAGLPKHHPRMHYYLNTFPHAHGRGRPVGPESDPHSILGFTTWLIEEIKGE